MEKTITIKTENVDITEIKLVIQHDDAQIIKAVTRGIKRDTAYDNLVANNRIQYTYTPDERPFNDSNA